LQHLRRRLFKEPLCWYQLHGVEGDASKRGEVGRDKRFSCSSLTLTVGHIKIDLLFEAANRLIAEPVGNCTDLVATVRLPLQKIYQKSWHLGPMSVVVDPFYSQWEAKLEMLSSAEILLSNPTGT
jgi:hypothetical protein